MGVESKFHPVEADDVRRFTAVCQANGEACYAGWLMLVDAMERGTLLDVCDVVVGASSGVTAITVVDMSGHVVGVGAVGPKCYNFQFLGVE